jgi:hypothetical protein
VKSYIPPADSLKSEARGADFASMKQLVAVMAALAALEARADRGVTSPAEGETLYTLAPTFRGLAKPGEEIVVQVDGVARAFGRAEEDGSWIAAVPFSEPLSEGAHVVKAMGSSVAFIARTTPALATACGCTASPSLLTIAFGAWVVRRRRHA